MSSQTEHLLFESALNVSVARKCFSTQIPMVRKQRNPRHVFLQHHEARF